MSERCERCFPGTIFLGHDQAGHRAASLLARAGWRAGQEQALQEVLEAELWRLDGVGPVTAQVIRDRLPR